MCFFAEDRELAWLMLAARCPDYHLRLWQWLEVNLHNTVHQQNMENLTKRWQSKVTGPYFIGAGFALWIHWGRTLDFKTKPCSDRIKDIQGFGGAWDCRSRVSSYSWCWNNQTNEQPPVKTKVTCLKEEGTLRVSLVSCLEAQTVYWQG